MKNRFYLACFRDNVGSSVGFHCKDGRGYSTNIDLAHLYTLEEAQYHYNFARSYDRPISADHVDELAVWKVDHQCLPTKSDLNPSNEYVAFFKNRWDGNDVYWVAEKGTTTNFLKALVISRSAAECINHDDFIVVPYVIADKAKRRTFKFSKYNPRVMTQGAGLKMPEHIKRARYKKENPMSHFNCHKCGKINWQHNPYDFEGCKHCYAGAI